MPLIRETVEALSIPRLEGRGQAPQSKADVLEAVQVAIPDAQVKRVKQHIAEVYIPSTGARFLLTIHKPRGEKGPRYAEITKTMVDGDKRGKRAGKKPNGRRTHRGSRTSH